MGTFYSYKKTDETMLEFIKRSEFSGCEIVASSIKLHVAYIAARLKTNEIIGVVVLIYRDKQTGQTGLKVMDETMGPFYYDCPDRVLNMLSPTNDQTALRWRETCRKNNSDKRLKQGDLKGKLFKYGGVVYRAEARHPRFTRSWQVTNLENGLIYRMAQSQIYKAELVEADRITILQ